MDRIILLDIDGVIAPVFSVDVDSHLVDIQWAKFVIPKHIAKFIEKISNLVNVIWISSWEESSYVISNKLNFNIDKHLTFTSKSNNWFKTTDLKNFIEINSDKEILLLDDEVCEFDEHFKGYSNLTIICPDDRTGLSPEDMGEIIKWVK